jgi:hypothetical protein
MCDESHRRVLPICIAGEEEPNPLIRTIIQKHFLEAAPFRNLSKACATGQHLPDAHRSAPRHGPNYRNPADFCCENRAMRKFDALDSAPKDTKPKGFIA